MLSSPTCLICSMFISIKQIHKFCNISPSNMFDRTKIYLFFCITRCSIECKGNKWTPTTCKFQIVNPLFQLMTVSEVFQLVQHDDDDVQCSFMFNHDDCHQGEMFRRVMMPCWHLIAYFCLLYWGDLFSIVRPYGKKEILNLIDIKGHGSYASKFASAVWK